MLIIVSQFHLFCQNSRRSSSWAWFSQPYLYLEFISLTFKPSNHFVVSRALYESVNCTTHEWKKLTSHHNGQMSQNLTDGQAPTLLCLRVSHLVLRRQRSRLLQDTHFRGASDVSPARTAEPTELRVGGRGVPGPAAAGGVPLHRGLTEA